MRRSVRLAWAITNRGKSYHYPERREDVGKSKGVQRKAGIPLKIA